MRGKKTNKKDYKILKKKIEKEKQINISKKSVRKSHPDDRYLRLKESTLNERESKDF